MKNNRFAALILILLLGSSIESEAKVCIGCGSQIPDNANYCMTCMTPQPQNATVGQQSLQKEPREVILDMFHFLDDYEGYFYNLQYLNILGKMPEIKTMFQNASMRYKNIEKMLPEECRLLANIYAAKYQLFEGITNVMKSLRVDSGYRGAILKSSLVTMGYYNNIINQFRVPRRWTVENINILKKQMENVNKRVQKYNVTSKYITLDDNKIPKGQPVMIISINGKNARVMVMGPSMTNDPIEGNMSLTNLEKRTTWKKENIFFFEDIPLKD